MIAGGQRRRACGIPTTSRVVSTGDDQGDIRRSESPDYSAGAASKTTACGGCGTAHRSLTIGRSGGFASCRAGRCASTWRWRAAGFGGRRCGKVKQEKFPWLETNPFYTKRFAWYGGRRCRATTVTEVAKELKLDWKTVTSLEKEYLHEQLRRTGVPGPKALGIDEIAIKQGHPSRIVVSDLERRRPIWFGGVDRSEQSMDLFSEWLAAKKTAGSQLAVRDRWRAVEPSTVKQAPPAAILYDTFHVMRHRGKALDTVRKQASKRLADKDRSFIKGQKYPLRSRKKNLTLEGRLALKKLLAANTRLNTAYVLKESFGQLWEYQSEGWARRLFENWKASLKRQRLKPFEDVAEMLERHGDGIAAYAKPREQGLAWVRGGAQQ